MRFNGKLFKGAFAIPLGKEEIGELLAAAKADWREVEPAIFGTLLEQALDEKERARLGAHYTPRAYVERLVVVTVIEPLRQEWAQVQATAERLKEEKEPKEAIRVVHGFHKRLCATRVLDPACGTGNFLYVALELMKRLEGEVLEALADLGGQEALATRQGERGPAPVSRPGAEPARGGDCGTRDLARLSAMALPHEGERAVRAGPARFQEHQGDGRGSDLGRLARRRRWKRQDGKRVLAYPNARRPDWPEANYIVGNPPFIGGKDFRDQFGRSRTRRRFGAFIRTSTKAPIMSCIGGTAPPILCAKGDAKRFGFVTTNSITQVFSRRVVARHLEAKKPVSLLMAIPDHPWTKATEKAAAVRIAMTVAAPGRCRRRTSRGRFSEAKLDTDQPEIELSAKRWPHQCGFHCRRRCYRMRASFAPMMASAIDGVQLLSERFHCNANRSRAFRAWKRPGLEMHIRSYRNGHDLTVTPRGVPGH